MTGKTLPTIKRRRDFLTAATGKKCVSKSLILQATKRPPEHPAGPEPRIGYTVTKKLGNAVIRNRIKRRLREAVRQVAPTLAEGRYDYVVIARHGALACDFSQLRRDMEFAFSQIAANKTASHKE